MKLHCYTLSKDSRIHFNILPTLVGDPKSNLLQLAADWCFYLNNSFPPIWIPAGYEYDGASIPRIPGLWELVGSPFEPKLQAPALAHDWLYLTHCVERKIADEVIYQLMLRNKVSSVRAHIIWGAVRLCAGMAWQNSGEDERELKRLRIQSNGKPWAWEVA